MYIPENEAILNEVIAAYDFPATLLGAVRYGSGHINDTFSVRTENGRYVLQRINKFVFKKPDEVMENIMKVTEFIRSKYLSFGEDYHRQVLRYYRNKNGLPYLIDENGEFTEEDHKYYCGLIKVSQYNDNTVCIKPGKAKSLVGKKFILSIVDHSGFYHSSIELEVS